MKKIFNVIFVLCLFSSCANNLENTIVDNAVFSQTRALRMSPGEVYTGSHYGFDYNAGWQDKVYWIKFSTEVCDKTGLKPTDLYEGHRYPGIYTVTFDPNLWEFSPAPSPECGFHPEEDGDNPQRGYSYKIIEPGKVELSSYIYKITGEYNYLKPYWDVWAPCRQADVLFRWYLTRIK